LAAVGISTEFRNGAAHHNSFTLAPTLVIGRRIRASLIAVHRRGESPRRRGREEHDFKKPDFQLRGVTTMTKTKIALAAVLFAATSSAAFAQGFDPDLSNRYQGYAQPGVYGYSASGKLGALQSAPIQSAPVSLKKHGNAYLQSAPVALRNGAVLQQRDVSLPITGAAGSGGWFDIERSDRASSPFAGGN
jgi:hypothetical protein